MVHDRNPLFVRLSDGSIRNGYTIKVLNMQTEPRKVTLTIEGLPGARLRLAGATGEPSPSLTFSAAPDALKTAKVYVHLPRADLPVSNTGFHFLAEASDDGEVAAREAVFESPRRDSG